jgi:transcriptional regulator with XRE-family HTH domain
MLNSMVAHTANQASDCARRIGQQLRQARRRRSDTQDDFARRIGISRYTLIKIERGDGGVAIDTYLRAAVALGIHDAVVQGFSPPPRSIFDVTPNEGHGPTSQRRRK